MYGSYGRYSLTNQNESVASGGSLLLDTYTAVGAWSVRLLKTGYSGALIRIRRDSDNAEKDFYPDGSNELSMTSEDGAGTSLSTWIGSDNGFVVTWYDQIGTCDLTQATTTRQPHIIYTGAFNTMGTNSKPAVEFNAGGDILSGTSASVTQPFTTIGSILSDDTTSIRSLMGWDNDSNYTAFRHGGASNANVTLGTALVWGTTFSSATHYKFMTIGNGTSSYINCNLGTGTTGDAGTNNGGTTLNVGARTAGTQNWNGDVHELILFNTDEGSNESALIGDLNTFYG